MKTLTIVSFVLVLSVIGSLFLHISRDDNRYQDTEYSISRLVERVESLEQDAEISRMTDSCERNGGVFAKASANLESEGIYLVQPNHCRVKGKDYYTSDGEWYLVTKEVLGK